MRWAMAPAALLLWGCGEGGPEGERAPNDAAVQPVVIDPKDRVCEVDADCAWGEIDHDIHKMTECVCVSGCPSLALAKSTVLRRLAQYEGVCAPLRTASGIACARTACDPPPLIACMDGFCAEASEAAAE